MKEKHSMQCEQQKKQHNPTQKYLLNEEDKIQRKKRMRRIFLWKEMLILIILRKARYKVHEKFLSPFLDQE